MENNKLTAEEQETDKHCSEKKVCRRKWLITYCLSSGRQGCALRGNPSFVVRQKAQINDGQDINDFMSPQHKFKLQLAS